VVFFLFSYYDFYMMGPGKSQVARYDVSFVESRGRRSLSVFVTYLYL
jgi:hypothetical protein